MSLTSPYSSLEPGVVETITVGHPMSSGGGLCVADGKIYIATDNGVDVFSLDDPANPTYLQTISTPYGAYDVHVFGTNAYVVMGSNPPVGEPNVLVLDLANSGVQTDCYYDCAPPYALAPYAIQYYNGKIYIVDSNGLKELSVGSVSGSLTVNLDAVPNDAQDFSFYGTDLGSFTLDDDSESTYSSTKTFSSLLAGDYAFHQTEPSGWIVSNITASDFSKVKYSNDGSSWHSTFASSDTWAKASVQAGGNLAVNFEDTRVYSISGHVIYDLDGNGTKNNYEGYVPDGWVVQLWKDGSYAAQTTTVSGAYTFSNLLTGNYDVRSILPTGWVNTVPASGTRSYSSLSSDQINQDFGVRGSQSIGGMKFNDLDGDGGKDAGEPGLNGWTIDLKMDSIKIASNQTAADGSYSFSGLAPGSYTVQEVAQNGWTQSYPATPGTHSVTLVAGVSGPKDKDFGNYQSMGFSGMKFEDLNGNGAKDEGEPGLSGWTIKLMSGATEIASTLTVTGGAYSFANIAPGSYTVEEVVQSGWTRSYPASPGSHAITLVSGVAGPTNINFGNWRATGFSGTNFEDLNGNGTKDAGEPGLSGWTIKLMNGATEIASTLTGTGGAYSFTGIAPGSYTVEEVVQAGWNQSHPASPGTHTINLVSGAAGPTNINFGNLRATGFSGLKFEDINGNAVKDAGEPGLSGWTIRLMSGATEIASTQTGTGGAYSFTDIAPGTYTVEEVSQAGWARTYPASPGTHTINLVSSALGPNNIDFGNARTTGFSGMKLEDLNGNGTKDAGEPGLSGWTIKLMRGATEVASTQTGTGGAYSFTNITPGSYTVEEAVQGGWNQSYPASPGSHAITLVSGVAGPTDLDFGNWNSTGFSGVKFEDLNGNGAEDLAEPGLSGWTIKLMKGATEIASTATAADGSYSFASIAPGGYTVQEVSQSGWTRSYPPSGTHAITLVSRVAGPTDINFGNWRATGFSGMKFEDLNGNGAKDAGEPGLSGWTIKLMNGTTEADRTLTGAGGAYSFTGIAPGSYTVEEAAQPGWNQSHPASPGTHTINLVSGVAGPTDINFGNWQSTGFSGLKFEDRNGNSVKDAGEPGLSGWTIKLMKDGNEMASTQTLADGTYSFTDIAPGSYTVEEVLQDDWLQTYPVSPGTHAINLVSGVAGPTSIDFGNWKTTRLSGMKFEDLNANEKKDAGELGLSGWTIRLMNGATEVASTVTAADGSYSFTGVLPGSYTVKEDSQAGWTQSYPASSTYLVTLNSGDDERKDIDFGNWRKTGLSGIKFDDINGNGVKDSGEPGLPGWTIVLKKGGLQAASPVVTDANGGYSFADIVPGSYTVEEDAKADWIQTCPASPGIYSLDMDSGIEKQNIDFGNFKASGFAGKKFEDKNGNGVKDSGEPGLPGWTILLKKDGADVASTVTDSNGDYYFADVTPGSYTVEETAQDGWTQTSPAGDIYKADSSSGQVKITRSDNSEVPATEANFGNRKLVEAFRVEIVADHQTVLPGQELVFTITINRVGDVLLDSLTANYTLPKGLKYISAIPPPQKVTENADGSTTLTWTDPVFSSFLAAQSSLQSVSFSPADAPAPSTTLTVTSEVQPDAPTILAGKVEITGTTSNATVDNSSDSVSVVVSNQPIYLIKTSDQEEVRPGATIGYTIAYGNLLKDANLTNVVITEQASSDLIFLSASPAPDQGTDNLWTIGDMAAGQKGTISVLFQVKNASNLSFFSQSSVSGSGFASTYRRLSTETERKGLRNSVTLTCKQFTPVSASHFVKLRESDGTSLLKTGHGSGEYQSSEVAALQMQNRSISTAGSLKAVYRPTSFTLPGGRSIKFNSEISSLTKTHNHAIQDSTSQAVRYAKSLEMDEKLLIDKNETFVSIEGSLEGQAHLGVLKKDGKAVKPAPIFESSQDYAGSFRFNSSLEDYGSNVRLIGNASGQGQASSDQRLKKSQRSFEHGNGSYESEQQASTAESYLAKNLSVSHDAQYGYGKWKSGIWSKSSGKSFLGQEVRGADFINEETVASGLNDLSSNISYRGQGRFRTVSEPDGKSKLDLDEEYLGEYSLQRKIRLGGVSHFDRPHLTLNKTGQMESGTPAADYAITVLNDGNTALGPVYVWDIFPVGTDYLSSSLKPAALASGYANWSLLYLGIGQSVTINLRLNVTESQDELVNLVYASGGYDDEWVTAGNMSVIEFGWLNCCEPDLFMDKQARIDSTDGQIIWYRILLQNRANVSLAAQIRDRLPAGLSLLNASAEPQVEGQDLVWVTGVIPAGESRFIEYRASALQDGRFVNAAWADAHALDGSGGTSTQASATVTLGNATSYSEDGWRPPEWGLDRMEMICDDEIAGDGNGCGSCPSCSCPLDE